MDDPFLNEPAGDHPGWLNWILRDDGRFNARIGRMLVRRDEDGRARCRLLTDRGLSNLGDAIHGGAILAFADMALFAAAHALGTKFGEAVTLDLSMHFIGAGRIDEPLDAVIERLRETGRFVFLRGLMVQEEHLVASFSGTLRKSSRPPPA